MSGTARQAISIDPAGLAPGLAPGLAGPGILLIADPAETALPAICEELAERAGLRG